MKLRQVFRGRACPLALSLLALVCCRALAAKLDSSNWVIHNFSGSLVTNLNAPMPPSNLRVVLSGPGTNAAPVTNSVASNVLTNLTDNSLGTFSTLVSPEVILIDLGQTCAVDRVLVLGTSNQVNQWPNYSQNGNTPPLGLLVVYIGSTTTTSNQVAQYTIPYDAGNPVETDADLRFSPAFGRYVRIELQNQVSWGANYWPGYAIASQPTPTNVAMNIRELELYGFTGVAATRTNVNAVVLPPGAAAPLALAAGDLSYYLGELSGSPHPIIAPQSTNRFSGTIYRIVDLAAMAPNYTTMMGNIASGVLNTNVQVSVSGREIVFSSWPYRCVLWSVWEFLERQGVRWVYPDAHGDYIPAGGGVNLSVVPFQYIPPTESIYANFNVNVLQPWPLWELQSVRQELLYLWRNHWTVSENGYGPLGGAEIPAMPSPGISVNSNYTEGFVGYPHNFGAVVPQRFLDQNSNWWGYSTTAGARIPPETNGAPSFCMDNPSLISWVASKMTNIAAAQPLACTSPLNLAHMNRPYNLLPLDATTYCADPQFCTASNGVPQANPEPWIKMYSNACSGEYYSFVTAVANQVQQMGSSALVGALAYADVFVPPANITTFPTNVQVEVCLYGAPNLPMTAPANAGLKSALDGWHATGARLATYDYALLHTDYWQQDPRVLVPAVAGALARSQYAASIGAADGGCQGDLSGLPYNPWNFYAYPRTRWNTNQTAAQIEQEFFNGYFREAAVPMLAFYQGLEQYQVTNGVNMHFQGYCYGITPGSFPLFQLYSMQTNLQQAQLLATNWFVINRVRNAVQSFNWVLSQRGITNSSSLMDYSPYVVVPTTGTFTVNLTNMSAPSEPPGFYYPAVWGSGGTWWFGTAGVMQQTLNFTQAGTYQVSVTASAPAPNQMMVYLGPSFGTTNLTSSSPQTYDFSLNIPFPSAWDLAFANNCAPCSFTIHQVQITKQ